MRSTSDAATERMATERMATERVAIESVASERATTERATTERATERAATERVAVNEKQYTASSFQQAPMTDAGVYSQLPAVERNSTRSVRPPDDSPLPAYIDRSAFAPTEIGESPPAYEPRRRSAGEQRPRSPEPVPRAQPAAPELPPMDLREMRLRLTAEPAEGRVAGPPRVRPVRARRRSRGIPWDVVGLVVAGLVAIGGAIAAAATWLPLLERAAEPQTTEIVGPHPPPDGPPDAPAVGPSASQGASPDGPPADDPPRVRRTLR